MAPPLLELPDVPDRRWDVVVVGAGAAGLAAAERLTGSGLSVALLEGRSAIGGRIRTRHIRGCAVPIELGAEFVHGRSEEIFEIASAAPLLVDRLPDSHLAATKSGWKPRDQFWDQFERITRQMRPNGRDRSVADFLRAHRSLSPVQKRLAASIVEGYHAAPLDRASEHALSTAGDPPSSPEEHAQFRVVAGYDGVTNWLRSRLEPRRCGMFLSTPVREIRWRRRQVTVRCEDGQEFRASRVIVTVPVGVLQAAAESEGAIRFDPLPPTLRQALSGIEMGRVVKVVLRFREIFWAGEGFLEERLADPARRDGELGFLHAPTAAFPTWWSASPAQAPLLTGWAGGPAADALRGLPPSAILSRASRTLAQLLAMNLGRLRGLLLGWHVHDWNADPFSRGAYSFVRVGGTRAPALLARPISETLFFAGEATSPDQSGTVPGAIESGRRAAQQILGKR
jgi:monoamine oxidase